MRKDFVLDCAFFYFVDCISEIFTQKICTYTKSKKFSELLRMGGGWAGRNLIGSSKID